MTHNGRPLSSLLALLAFTPTITLASAAFESGFYIGAKVGAQEAMASWDQANSLTTFIEVSNSPINEVILQMNQSEEGQSFHTNIMGNFAVGYAVVVSNLFLAVEGSANIAAAQEFDWDNTNTTSTGVEFEIDGGEGIFIGDINTTLSSETELTLDPDVNLDIRPGLLLAKNFLLYGRVGVAFTRLSIEQQATTAVDGDFENIIPKMNEVGPFSKANLNVAEDADDILGLRVGLGVEYKITPTVGLNVDYVFTDYGSIDTSLEAVYIGQSQPSEDISTTTLVSSNADVTKNTLTAGVNWYFGGKKERAKRERVFWW